MTPTEYINYHKDYGEVGRSAFNIQMMDEKTS